MTISVIVPGLNCAETLPSCLAAIAASTRKPDEVIFFDDGSSDGSGAVAAAAGVRVLRNDGPPLGPAIARNRAVMASGGDILVFIDSDVVVHPEAIERLARSLSPDETVVAAFGSYDRNPPARNIASLYMNLRHHAVHQQGRDEAASFWAGLGAVRRTAFIAADGFSKAYGRPSIEDIELGTRLIAAGGRIRLIHDAQGSHWKRWSLGQVWRTDVLQRAIPWSRLIAERQMVVADLNAGAGEKRAAILAHLLPAALAGATLSPWMLLATVGTACAYAYQNRKIYGVFSGNAPKHQLPALITLHWLYHIYASQIFGWTALKWRFLHRSQSSR